MADLYPTLPPRFRATLVGEGAANVVFELAAPPTDPHAAFLQGKLLRVPKSGTRAYSYEELQRYWEGRVKPLFSDGDLVQHHLVRLGNSRDVAAQFNAILAQEWPRRRTDFVGSTVADVEIGMLVEDMRKTHPGDLTLEFKPKWLAQSPSAPPLATRCRTCARRAMRQASNPGTSTRDIFCPLDLLRCRDNDAALDRAMRHLLTGVGAEAGAGAAPLSSPQADRLRHWFRTNALLGRLRDLQQELDPRGPLEACAAGDDDPDFPLAMTLRDCTVFVRVPADEGRPVEAKLGDLDRKNWAAKREYWRAMETHLADGGFYRGTEEPRQRTHCALDR